MTDTRTYRGRSLAELVPRIRAELGDEAVILESREAFDGGLGGFFQKRLIEVEAARPPLDFDAELERAAAEGSAPAAPAVRPHVDERVTDVTEDDVLGDRRIEPAERLAALFAAGTHEAAPEPEPTPEPAPHVAALPAAEGLAPAPPPVPVGAPSPEGAVLADALVARGLPRAIAGAAVAEASGALAAFAPGTPLRDLVVQALARRIPVATLGAGPRVVAFVGPGGAGKTRCASALLAAHARTGAPVAAVALRAPDAGAGLARLLAPHGVPVHAAPDGAAAAVHAEQGLAVLDCPGVSPRAEAEVRELAADLRAAGAAEVHLAVPATIGADAARELLDGCAELGVTSLALTHADETGQLGTVAGLAIEAGVPLAFVAGGRSTESGLAPADPVALAEALLS